MKAKRRMRGTKPAYVLVSHEPRQERLHGNACWDCDRMLSHRVTVVCRGVHPGGEWAFFSLCNRCGEREKRENLTGTTRRWRIGRRLYLSGLGAALLTVGGLIAYCAGAPVPIEAVIGASMATSALGIPGLVMSDGELNPRRM
jgi:hypothetical protein